MIKTSYTGKIFSVSFRRALMLTLEKFDYSSILSFDVIAR